jgi:hypothetical protein
MGVHKDLYWFNLRRVTPYVQFALLCYLHWIVVDVQMGERGNSVPGLCGAGVKSGSRLKKKKMRENFSREEKEEAESKPLLSLFIKQGGHVTWVECRST